MEKIVKSCGECDFHQGDRIGFCSHSEGRFYVTMENPFVTIHPNCPEKGAFIIKTQKIEDETTTI